MLSDDLARVEEHGFLRTTFPMEYSGHTLDILHNDAYEKADGRLYVRFMLYCVECDQTHTVRGVLPRHADDPYETLARAKLATIGKFKYVDCV